MNVIPGHHMIVIGTRDILPAEWQQESFEIRDMLSVQTLNELVSRATMQISHYGTPR